MTKLEWVNANNTYIKQLCERLGPTCTGRFRSDIGQLSVFSDGSTTVKQRRTLKEEGFEWKGYTFGWIKDVPKNKLWLKEEQVTEESLNLPKDVYVYFHDDGTVELSIYVRHPTVSIEKARAIVEALRPFLPKNPGLPPAPRAAKVI